MCWTTYYSIELEQPIKMNLNRNFDKDKNYYLDCYQKKYQDKNYLDFYQLSYVATKITSIKPVNSFGQN